MSVGCCWGLSSEDAVKGGPDDFDGCCFSMLLPCRVLASLQMFTPLRVMLKYTEDCNIIFHHCQCANQTGTFSLEEECLSPWKKRACKKSDPVYGNKSCWSQLQAS